MSLNYIRALEPVAVYDPKIDFDLEEEGAELGNADNSRMYGDKYLVYRGPKNIEYFAYQPTSSASNTGASTDFTYFMPSRESVLDRCIFLRANITVNMTKKVAGLYANVPFQFNKFALKAFPLHHCIKVLQLQIDGNVYTIDLQNAFPHLKYFSYTEDEIKTWSSLAPTLLDNSAVYDTPTTNNVLSSVDSGTAFVPPRGRFAFNSLVQVLGADAIVGPPPVAAVAAQGTLTYTVTEPIQLSPLILNAIRQSQSTGLTGLANIKIKITWRDINDAFYNGFCLNTFDVNTMYSQMLITGVVTDPTFDQAATLPNLADWTSTLTIDTTELILGVLTQNDVSIAPPINSYDFLKYDTYVDATVLAKDAQKKFSYITKTYNLSQIPHYVLFAAVPTQSSYIYTNFLTHTSALNPIYINQLPDFYFGVQNVNIKLGNRSGLLANAPPQILYEMNRQNGLVFQNFSNSGMSSNTQYNLQFQNGGTNKVGVPQGAPLLLQFGKDIGIDDASLAPGCAVNTTFYATLQLNNPYAGGIDMQVIILFLYCGIYTVSTTGTSYSTSVLSREDVLNSDMERVDSDDLAQQQGISGGVFVGGRGSFLKKIKSFGKKVYHALKSPTTQRLIREVLDTADILGVPGAGAINQGIQNVELARDIAQQRAGARGGVLSHSVISGGSVLTTDQIRRRLMKK